MEGIEQVIEVLIYSAQDFERILDRIFNGDRIGLVGISGWDYSYYNGECECKFCR